MKIRAVIPPYHSKVLALLRQAFPGSTYETQLFDNLHKNNRELAEWVCLHTDTVIAYIAFSRAYRGSTVCGLHLAPLAVKPDFQRQGIGSELLRFALRQDIIREHAIFVLGDPAFYQRFGFTPCTTPICPFDDKNDHFLSIRNTSTSPFLIGYEPEFASGTTDERRKKGSAGTRKKQQRAKRSGPA